jgi:hypothetical protein
VRSSSEVEGDEKLESDAVPINLSIKTHSKLWAQGEKQHAWIGHKGAYQG